MKPLIYSGIGLFAVATAFGLVDYYGAKRSGTIQQLYLEDEVKHQVVKEKTAAENILVERNDLKNELVTEKVNPKKNNAQEKKKKYPIVKPLEFDMSDTIELNKILPDLNNHPEIDTTIKVTEEKENFVLRPEIFSRGKISKKKFKGSSK